MRQLVFIIFVLLGVRIYPLDSVLDLETENIQISPLSSNEILYDNNANPMLKVIITSQIKGLSFDGNIFKQTNTENGYELWVLNGTKRLIIRHPQYLTGNIKLPFITKGGTLITGIDVILKDKNNIANLSELRQGKIKRIYVQADRYAQLLIDGVEVSSKNPYFYLYPGTHVFETITPLGKYSQTVLIEENTNLGLVDVRNAAYIRLALSPRQNEYSKRLFKEEESKKIPFIGIMSNSLQPIEYTDIFFSPMRVKGMINQYFVPLQAFQYSDYDGYIIPRVYSTLYFKSKSLNEMQLSPRDYIELELKDNTWKVKTKEKLPIATSLRILSEEPNYDDIENPFDFKISEELLSEDLLYGELPIEVAISYEKWVDLYIDGQKIDGGATVFSASPGEHLFESKYHNRKYSVNIDIQHSDTLQMVDVALGGEIWIYKPSVSEAKISLLPTKKSVEPNYIVQEESSYEYIESNRTQTMKCDLIKYGGLLGTYIIKAHGLNSAIEIEPRQRVLIYGMPAKNNSIYKVLHTHQITNITKNLQKEQIK